MVTAGLERVGSSEAQIAGAAQFTDSPFNALALMADRTVAAPQAGAAAEYGSNPEVIKGGWFHFPDPSDLYIGGDKPSALASAAILGPDLLTKLLTDDGRSAEFNAFMQNINDGLPV